MQGWIRLIAFPLDVVVGQLEAFVEAARLGSVSRAASALYISQPALTARLKALEQQLGIDLLVRHAGGVRLSDAGAELLPEARRILAGVARANEVARRLRQGVTGHLAIAASSSLASAVLPQMLRRFQAVYPGIHVSVRTGHPSEVLELVLHEEVELGMGCDVADADLELIPLYLDELVLVMRGDGAPSTSYSDALARHPLIVFRDVRVERVLRLVGERTGTPCIPALEVDTIEAAKRMVEHGLGVAVLPRSTVAADAAAGRLAYLPIDDSGLCRRHIVAMRRRDAQPLSGPAARFLSDRVVHGDGQQRVAADQSPPSGAPEPGLVGAAP